MMKHILKYRAFDSSDEIEEAIARIEADLTFDTVQSVFQNWMSRLAWAIEKRKVCSQIKKELEVYVA
jgi:hypothetical protein